jgi:hypothetical protein
MMMRRLIWFQSLFNKGNKEKVTMEEQVPGDDVLMFCV